MVSKNNESTQFSADSNGTKSGQIWWILLVKGFFFKKLLIKDIFLERSNLHYHQDIAYLLFSILEG